VDTDELDRTFRALVAGAHPASHEMSIRLRGDDALAEELDAIAGAVGAPRFALHDGELIAWTKPYGNPWALHGDLASMRALSARIPARRFEVELEPEAGSGVLQAGVFTGVPFAALDAWVRSHPRPRLAGCDVRATLTCWGSRSACAAISTRVARGGGAALAELPGGLAISIDRADRIVDVVGSVLREIEGGQRGAWRAELVLTGDAAWRCQISEFMAGVQLRLVLGELLRDVPPVPEPPPAAIVLAPAPRLAELALPEQLQLELAEDDWRALGRDGSFVAVSAPPQHVSADGRHRLQVRGHDPPRMQRTDAATGAMHDVPAGADPYRRTALGFIGPELVLIETALQLGRIRKRIVVHAFDGAERTSRMFIHPAGLTLDPEAGRVHVVAERDGVPELRAVDLARFEETVVHVFEGGPPPGAPGRTGPVVPRQLFVHDGVLLGVVSGRDTALVRYAAGGADVIARVCGSLEYVIRDEASLTLVTAEVDRSVADRCETFLHRLALGGEQLGTVRLGTARTERFAAAGAWRAWHGRDTGRVAVYEGLAPCDEVAVPSGHRVAALAMSPGGALACVLDAVDGDTALLAVARRGRQAQIALPASARIRWHAPVG